MNPNLKIDRSALLHNMNVIKKNANKNGVSVSVVTKGLTGHEALVDFLVMNGADSICEANIKNLIKFKNIPAEKWLIRSPLISETDETVRYADVSLVSESLVIKALSAAAVSQGIKHKVVVMIELGELREGCMPDELGELCSLILTLPGLILYGVGSNLSCINDIVPDDHNMMTLSAYAAAIEKTLGYPLPVVSGGSSSAVKMLSEGRLPSKINHLRIGEAILLGNIVCYDIPYAGARTDAFTLNVEIIEVKDKPSEPWGELATGQKRINGDHTSYRKRALVAIGKQDVFSNYLVPLDPKMKIVGDSSDCLVVDITDSQKIYKPGDTCDFRLKYNGLVSAMASEYIEKILL